jgi:hypothetical protein
MKNFLMLGVGVLVIAALAVFALMRFDDAHGVLGEDITAVVYTLGDTPTGNAAVSVPFVGESDGGFVNVVIDANGDGTLNTDTEWVVRNQEARVLADYRNNFSFAAGGVSIGDEPLVRVTFTPETFETPLEQPADGEVVERRVVFVQFNAGDVLGIDVPGAHEELKRGLGAVAQAQGSQSVSGTFNGAGGSQVPDLPQGTMECTAVSVANNLISLAGKNSQLDDLPNTTQELVDELKQDMKFKDGILLGNIAAGKRAFVQRHNLPIITEQINNPTFQDIKKALDSGAAVELSMSMVRSASGRASTGHVVTAVGTTAAGQVQVHDPATPGGMETLDLPATIQAGSKRFEGVNYPMWDGISFIDAIFVQTWKGAQQATTGTTLNTSSVDMLVIGGQYFPKSQFRAVDPDVCGAAHWHASGTVYGLQDRNSTTIVNATDPASGACGFGKVGEVPEQNIDITFEQSTQLIRFVVP